MVLLARDTPPAAPGIKDLSIDMSQWQPLIEDRAFVSWLVKVGGDAGPPAEGCGWAPTAFLCCIAGPARSARSPFYIALPPAQAPGEHEVLRARHLTIHQVTKLEELWRSNPAASGAGGWQAAAGGIARVVPHAGCGVAWPLRCCMPTGDVLAHAVCLAPSATRQGAHPPAITRSLFFSLLSAVEELNAPGQEEEPLPVALR